MLDLDAALARGFLREVTSFAAQRRLMENADERLRQPEQGGRLETGCVVCARRFWREQLKMLILFQDPAGATPSWGIVRWRQFHLDNRSACVEFSGWKDTVDAGPTFR